MKATELFVGALVCAESQSGICEVKEILSDYWIDPKCIRHDYERTEPIQLTREILEKNGFVEWSDHSQSIRSCSMLFDKNTSFCVQEKDGSDSYFTQINRSGTGTFEHRMHIKYVHQLQQLFRLCGINKKITI